MKKTISKYWHIFQVNWQASIAYRAELTLWAIIDALPLISLFILWFSVYRYGESLSGYSYQDLVSYYILGYLITRITNTNFEISYVDQVRSGEISKFFLKPFSLRKLLVIEELSWRVLNLIIIVIPITIGIILLTDQPLTNLEAQQLPILIMLLILAFILNCLISLIILAGSFFMDQGRTMSHFKWMLEGIFSGAMLPLSAYPPALQHLARILPFQFRFAVPVEFALGQLSGMQLITSLIIAFVWIVALYLIMKILWVFALRRFTAVGN